MDMSISTLQNHESTVTSQKSLSVMERAEGFLVTKLKPNKWARFFTTATRMLLALGFLLSGLTKALSNRFTMLGLDNPVGFFFEGLYRSGFYWNFIGIAQLTAAILLLIPRTATLGATIYFPIILNIFLITMSLHFTGTPFITGSMLVANIYLLCWDYDKLKYLVKR